MRSGIVSYRDDGCAVKPRLALRPACQRPRRAAAVRGGSAGHSNAMDEPGSRCTHLFLPLFCCRKTSLQLCELLRLVMHTTGPVRQAKEND